MRIKLLVGLVTADHVAHKPRSVVEWDDAEAGRFIAAGYAVAVETPGDAAAVEVPTAETAAAPAPKVKRKGK